MVQRSCPNCSVVSETEKGFCPECGTSYDRGWTPPQQPAPQGQGSSQSEQSGLAIASMVLGIVWLYWLGSVLAVIFGHVALSQMRKDPSIRGRGFAIAGVTLGWIGVGLLLLVIFGVFATAEW